MYPFYLDARSWSSFCLEDWPFLLLHVVTNDFTINSNSCNEMISIYNTGALSFIWVPLFSGCRIRQTLLVGSSTSSSALEHNVNG